MITKAEKMMMGSVNVQKGNPLVTSVTRIKCSCYDLKGVKKHRELTVG